MPKQIKGSLFLRADIDSHIKNLPMSTKEVVWVKDLQRFRVFKQSVQRDMESFLRYGNGLIIDFDNSTISLRQITGENSLDLQTVDTAKANIPNTSNIFQPGTNADYGISFGKNNLNSGNYSFISGEVNRIYSNSLYSAIFGKNNISNGGSFNQIFGENNSSISSSYTAVFGKGNTLNSSSYTYVYGENHDIHSSNYAFVIGNNNYLSNADYSFIHGQNNLIYSTSSHAEGSDNTIYASNSHAEGSGNVINANANNSHVEGNSTLIGANATNAHAEGYNTSAMGTASHSEGNSTQAKGSNSHAEGNNSIAHSANAHAEGVNTNAFGIGSHAEGELTEAGWHKTLYDANSIEEFGGTGANAKGKETRAIGDYSLASGYKTIAGWESFEGDASKPDSKRHGHGQYSHAEGQESQAKGDYSHAEGYQTVTEVDSLSSHAEGQETITYSNYSHAEGYQTKTYSDNTHAEGNNTEAGIRTWIWDTSSTGHYSYDGLYSHAEGEGTKTEANFSHAEGYNTVTSSGGLHSHAEGDRTIAKGQYSHAEGSQTKSTGIASHASGLQSEAIADNSFTHGIGTITNVQGQVTFGTFNVGASLLTLLEIGMGTSDSDRKNAIEVFKDGTIVAPNATNSNIDAKGGKALVTKEWVQDNITSSGSGFYSEVEKITECAATSSGGGCIDERTGWRMRGVNSTFYGYIGQFAIDMTIADAGDSTNGALGYASHSVGYNTIAQNNYQFSAGAFNVGTDVNTLVEIGIGTDNANRKNAIEVFKDGTIVAPNATTPNLDAHGYQSLMTLQYFYDHGGGQASQLDRIDWVTSGSGSGAGAKHGWRIYDWHDNSSAYGQLGEFAIDLTLQDPNHVSTTYKGAKGKYSFANGYDNTVSGDYSYVEGTSNIVYAPYAHAEGYQTVVGATRSSDGSYISSTGDYAHAEGYQTEAWGKYSHAEGYQTRTGKISSATNNNDADPSFGNYAHAEGYGSQAQGNYSHAEGVNTQASGGATHTEGEQTKATNSQAHAEGYKTTAIGVASHAEGRETTTYSDYAHAEGEGTAAVGTASHAEGLYGHAGANYSHAEGWSTNANGVASHAEGAGSSANGANSHAEGEHSLASGVDAHAEGYYTIASNDYSHAQGYYTKTGADYQDVSGKYNVGKTDTLVEIGIGTSDSARGNAYELYNDGSLNLPLLDTTKIINRGAKALVNKEYVDGLVAGNVSQMYKITEGSNTGWRIYGVDPSYYGDIGNNAIDFSISNTTSSVNGATGNNSFAVGYQTIALGQYAHAEGYISQANGTASHVEGNINVANGNNSHAEGYNTLASGNAAHSEGHITIATSDYSHAEGDTTSAGGTASHAEGNQTKTFDANAHAEGLFSEAHGANSHAEGNASKSNGISSHAEGNATQSNGLESHAEGHISRADGDYAHAEGHTSVASGVASHAEGYFTKAVRDYSHASGMYNIGKTTSLFEIGIGTSDSARGNAFEIDDSGYGFLPKATVSGISNNSDGTILITKDYLTNVLGSQSGTFVGLTDTPASIIANQMVVGDSSGTGLIFQAIPDGSLVGTKQVDETNIGNGKVLEYDSSTGKLEYVTPATSDVSAFTDLTDTPASIIANQMVVGDSSGTGLIFQAIPDGSLVGTKQVDETNIGNGKVLEYDSSSGKMIYTPLPDGSLVGTKQVDETNIGNGKVLEYDSSSGKMIYVTPATSDVSTFTDLTDTPSTLGTAGQVVQVNANGDALEFVDAPSGGSTSFVGLTDTPSDYTNAAGKALKVNASGNGVEFVSEEPIVTPKDDSNSSTISFDFTKELFDKVIITGDVTFTGTNMIAGYSGKIFVYQDNNGGHSITFDNNVFLWDDGVDIQPDQTLGKTTYYEFNVYSSNAVYIIKRGSFAVTNTMATDNSGNTLAVNSSGDTLATTNKQ